VCSSDLLFRSQLIRIEEELGDIARYAGRSIFR
jgi:hypothetical protein